MKTVSVRMDEALIFEVDRLALECGVTRSEFVRAAVTQACVTARVTACVTTRNASHAGVVSRITQVAASIFAVLWAGMVWA